MIFEGKAVEGKVRLKLKHHIVFGKNIGPFNFNIGGAAVQNFAVINRKSFYGFQIDIIGVEGKP